MLSISTTVYFHSKGALDSQPQVIKVYQLLADGRWFSPGTQASSTTKTGRHDIAEILLKVAFSTINKPINQFITTLRIALFMTRRRSKTKSVLYTSIGV